MLLNLGGVMIDIKIREYSKYKEVIIEYQTATIDLGFLDKKEQLELINELGEAIKSLR